MLYVNFPPTTENLPPMPNLIFLVLIGKCDVNEPNIIEKSHRSTENDLFEI